MLTFMTIPTPEAFLSLVDHSCGSVFLCLPDGGRCDLKREPLARQLFRALVPGREGVRISLSDPDDTPAFFRYMAGAAR